MSCENRVSRFDNAKYGKGAFLWGRISNGMNVYLMHLPLEYRSKFGVYQGQDAFQDPRLFQRPEVMLVMSILP